MSLKNHVIDMLASILLLPAAIGFGLLALVMKVIPPLQDRLGLSVLVLAAVFVGAGLTTGVLL